MRDRVQKLEDHLQSSKKRLSELKTGKPSLRFVVRSGISAYVSTLSFRAPSLDTVNRTFRNIDIAIKQQSGDVDKIQQRMSKLDLSSNVIGPRDKRISESSVKKPPTVIPDVAVTTAAALNAERSAQKLKRALLAARKEPLLGKAASHTAPPTSFLTPGRPTVKSAPETPTPTGILSLATIALPAFTPGWSPETSVNYDDSPSYGVSSRRPHRTPRHGSSAKSAAMLKQSENLESPTPAPKLAAVSFDWGPLPTATPKATLSADVRPKIFGL
jgi:nucleoporin NUP159